MAKWCQPDEGPSGSESIEDHIGRASDNVAFCPGDGHHDMLGHTTLQMTSRYTHAMPQNLRTSSRLKSSRCRFAEKRRARRSAPTGEWDGWKLIE